MPYGKPVRVRVQVIDDSLPDPWFAEWDEYGVEVDIAKRQVVIDDFPELQRAEWPQLVYPTFRYRMLDVGETVKVDICDDVNTLSFQRAFISRIRERQPRPTPHISAAVTLTLLASGNGNTMSRVG